jgi:dipeptidyl aminopeptidase/acylaminoacyl peptidase
MFFRGVSATLILLCSLTLAAQTNKRPLSADDIYRMQQVDEPQVSPDGQWVAYTVTTIDRSADKRVTSIWMVSWDGARDVQVTRGASSSSPRWSPDGKYLSFLSARPEESKTEVWVLDRNGGEARQLTNVKSDVDDYVWSPDSKRLILVVQEGEEEPTAVGEQKTKVPKPIVINAFRFKQDVSGYVSAGERERLYLFDVDTQKATPVADSKFDQNHPAWSPDGSQIAFVGSETADPDQSGTNDLFIVSAQPGAKPRKFFTAFSTGNQRLVWNPKGTQIAFLQGFEPKYNAYEQSRLALIPAEGGTPQFPTANFDRSTAEPEFTKDGSALTFLVPDDRLSYLGTVPVAGGKVERASDTAFVLNERHSGGGHSAVVAGNDTSAQEVYALEDRKLRRLTHHNDALLSELQLGPVEDISFRSKDGTEIHGMMIRPASYQAGKKYPTLLWIHGGPNGQDEHELEFGLYPLQLERQFFAAQGYVVLAINYRGSSGRGAEFTRSIFADWGNKEVADLLAAVDYAVQKGIADPERLGIGGWSYGGILTDYTTASDPRFKAAISGAGSANQISMYGSDQYILQYTNELGPPWKSQDLWVKLSYPFFHADRIHTPTLYMGGQSDFNVPIIGGEQMYQALRVQGVPTELVVYPGQFHLFTRPSYIHDRLLRYAAWYQKYLNPRK